MYIAWYNYQEIEVNITNNFAGCFVHFSISFTIKQQEENTVTHPLQWSPTMPGRTSVREAMVLRVWPVVSCVRAGGAVCQGPDLHQTQYLMTYMRIKLNQFADTKPKCWEETFDSVRLDCTFSWIEALFEQKKELIPSESLFKSARRCAIFIANLFLIS